ncbi:hypothetical protein CEP88_12690 [Roseobacter denitrificans]|nr:hypothetical protein [Roseobacter denitrificans]AVL53385.1 hypothetical protein CEP88_12690 [Roseobacter denitrificans]SFF70531.1 hypothetical protein SAMN05443635_101208 [Roseobacter denitrificans OCh 114]
MKSRLILMIIAVWGLGACTATTGGNAGFIRNLPEEIVAMAAPNQDLTAVQLKEDDGCYWYRHTGPVETTMLPLRTAEGRPICTRPQT